MKILTFDIEEWFHILDHPDTRSSDQWDKFPSRIEGNVDRILDLLDQNQCLATFFCLGWVAEKYPRIIRRIVDRGHELATHSHVHQLAYEQSPMEFRADLKRSIQSIYDASGVKVTAYRAPGFSVTSDNLWIFQVLLEEGISVDCSVFPATRAHGGLPVFSIDQPCIINCPGGRLKELPINVQNIGQARVVFSGGGYFRVLPNAILRLLFEKHGYVMTYFHPRDFDPGQPVVPNLRPHRRFKSYVGLGGALKKLDALLKTFSFINVKSAIGLIDWDSCSEVTIHSPDTNLRP